MEKYIDKIIISVLKGKDYRPYVLATINKRFVDTVYLLLKKILEARQKNKSEDWWIKELVENSAISKRELLWFVGLNNKTVTNMANTAKREVCIDLGKENINSIKMLAEEIEKMHDGLPYIEIKLKHRKEEIILSEKESIQVLNTISAMKLTVQGGAWSEVGKKKGVNIIELRDEKALTKIGEYLKKEGFNVKNPPKITEIEKLVPQITKKYNEDLENKKIMFKAKELVK